LITMVAGIFYVLSAMAVVAHALPHTDHADGFVLNMQFTTNSGTCACASGSSTLVKVQSHADFLDGALLEHPAIKGDYLFSPATDQHPRGFFVKAAVTSGGVTATPAMAMWSMKDNEGTEFWVIGNQDQMPTTATSNVTPKIRAIAKTSECPNRLTDALGDGNSLWRFTHEPHQTLIAGKSLIVTCVS